MVRKGFAPKIKPRRTAAAPTTAANAPTPPSSSSTTGLTPGAPPSAPPLQRRSHGRTLSSTTGASAPPPTTPGQPADPAGPAAGTAASTGTSSRASGSTGRAPSAAPSTADLTESAARETSGSKRRRVGRPPTRLQATETDGSGAATATTADGQSAETMGTTASTAPTVLRPPPVVRAAPAGPMLPPSATMPDANQRALVVTSSASNGASAAAVALDATLADTSTSDARRKARKKQPRPPSDQMRVKDHIYFNPPKPKAHGKRRRNSSTTDKTPGSGASTPIPPASPSTPRAPSTAATAPPTPDSPVQPVSAPQVVLDAATGKFVVDPTSLEQRSTVLNQETVGELVQARSPASYSAYSKRTASKKWSNEETETFYRGVRTFGLDFDMIQKFFLPERDHTQLKNKYNREDKRDRAKMDFCLNPKNRLEPSAIEGTPNTQGTADDAAGGQT
eukprot:m.169547 g.169547  ORF g.169547 m.169547 type:complete len:450 (+) comp13117_c0_seq1:89-1438(+)